MNKTKYSFVILLEFVPQTLTELQSYNLKLIPLESDLELGYLTVTGTPSNVNKFRQFIQGEHQ